MQERDIIRIRGARENNLKDVSLDIPKYQITVFTGVSGSGKSSLVLDTIAAKSRRELNDTFPTFVQQYLPKYGRPHVDEIEGLPIAVVIDQKKPAKNSRSTVGTYTDIYALMRLLFSRVGKPFVGYSDSFSFNHPQGSCPRCSGLGEIRELDIHKLVDFDKSLNDEDTIHYIAFGKGGWRWIRYAHSGLFDLDKKIKDYSPEELDLFLNSPQIKLKNPQQACNFSLEDIDLFAMEDFNSGRWEIHTFAHKSDQMLHDLGSNETAKSNNMSWALVIPSSTFRWPIEGESLGLYKEGILTGAYMKSGHSYAQWVRDHTICLDWFIYPTTGLVY